MTGELNILRMRLMCVDDKGQKLTFVYFFLICNIIVKRLIIFSDIIFVRSVTYEQEDERQRERELHDKGCHFYR